jgi:hypothetical protein
VENDAIRKRTPITGWVCITIPKHCRILNCAEISRATANRSVANKHAIPDGAFTAPSTFPSGTVVCNQTSVDERLHNTTTLVPRPIALHSAACERSPTHASSTGSKISRDNTIGHNGSFRFSQDTASLVFPEINACRPHPSGTIRKRKSNEHRTICNINTPNGCIAKRRGGDFVAFDHCLQWAVDTLDCNHLGDGNSVCQ